MKNINVFVKASIGLASFFMASTAMASINTGLESLCNYDRGTLLPKKKIQYINAAVNFNDGNDFEDAIGIKLFDSANWYYTKAAMSVDHNRNYNALDGVLDIAKMAYVLAIPVDVCIKDGYLRGLEMYSN